MGAPTALEKAGAPANRGGSGGGGGPGGTAFDLPTCLQEVLDLGGTSTWARSLQQASRRHQREGTSVRHEGVLASAAARVLLEAPVRDCDGRPPSTQPASSFIAAALQAGTLSPRVVETGVFCLVSKTNATMATGGTVCFQRFGCEHAFSLHDSCACVAITCLGSVSYALESHKVKSTNHSPRFCWRNGGSFERCSTRPLSSELQGRSMCNTHPYPVICVPTIPNTQKQQQE